MLRNTSAEQPPPAKIQLASVISEAASENDVLAWLAQHNIKRSELAHQQEPTLSTALMLAVRRCMLAVTSSLLSVQAPVQIADRSGDTPLHWACLRSGEVPGMVGTLEQLLEAGADANAIGDLGNTPLHLAATANCVAAIKLLVMHGAALDCTNSTSRRPKRFAPTRSASR